MSSKQNRKNVQVVLFDHDGDVRQNLKSSLADENFTSTHSTASLKSAQAALYNNEADLFIVDIDKEKGVVCDLMRKIRHHEAGDNPFPVSIAMSNDPDFANIRQAVNSGFDVLLLKPFSMETFLKRVHHLTHFRNQFAVTSDYIGPDRRGGKRDNPNQHRFPMLDAPNPVKIMAGDEMTRAEMHANVQETIQVVNERRVQANGYTVTDIIGKLASLHLQGEVNERFIVGLRKLRSISQDMNRRLERSKYAHVAELFETMGEIADRNLEDPLNPSSKDLELLQNLSRAIERAFEADEDEAMIAHSITDSIRAIA